MQIPATAKARTADERLRRALQHAAHGRGAVAVVTDEAGIGKSSLLGALAASALPRSARVLLGRSYERASILAFGPWVDAFRSAGVIRDDKALEALSPVWRSELARVLPEFHQADLPAPSDDQLRLFEAVAQLFERLAARQLLVVILEDVHWADEMNLRLLAFVSRRSDRWPLLLLASAREEELAEVPAVRRILDEVTRQDRAVAVRLGPLSRPETDLLVRSLARPGPDNAVIGRLEERAWRVSEGNPFVVVETVRAMQDASTLEQSVDLSVPRRVHDLIAGRLERLSARARDLAAVAAVIGREFDFPLLYRASDQAEGPPPRASRNWCAVASCTDPASASISSTTGSARSSTDTSFRPGAS